MNKKELIEEISDRTDLTKARVTKVVDAFVTAVSKAIAKGHDVRIVDFGTFTVVHRRASEGRDPRTGAAITIAARNKPKFKPGKALTEAVNKASKKKGTS
jgi:DNA-binding protein HU-beta